MDYPLKILRKHLANEKYWLDNERLGSIDPKFKAGAAMARERVPQLEDAIKLLSDTVPKVRKPRPVAVKKTQLNLFNLFK